MRTILLLCVLVAGCGGVNIHAQDAHDVTEAALDCIDNVQDGEDIRVALVACGADTLRTISTLCSAGLIPRGEFCDAVGGVL